ncbi:hydrogenase formation protein HypD [Arcanobacterium hippocoleae]
MALYRARIEGLKNFSIFCNHVRIEPPLRTILNSDGSKIDGFIGPGHVATITGTHAFDFIPREYNLPVVVAGFEPLDILQSVTMLLEQYVSGGVAGGNALVENQYARVVRDNGNPAALGLMEQTFARRAAFEWRGLGFISDSGFGIHPDYAQFDAELIFNMPAKRVPDPQACECGSVLVGKIKPWECKVFGTACTPANPIGTCMVSPEGACAAYYNFGRIDKATAQSVVIAD